MEKGCKTELQLLEESKMACRQKGRPLSDLQHELQELNAELQTAKRQGSAQDDEIISLRDKVGEAKVLREDLFDRCETFEFERCQLLTRQAELATRIALLSELLEVLKLDNRSRKRSLLGSSWVAGVGLIGSIVLFSR